MQAGRQATIQVNLENFLEREALQTQGSVHHSNEGQVLTKNSYL